VDYSGLLGNVFLLVVTIGDVGLCGTLVQIGATNALILTARSLTVCQQRK
jgi:hypothetical protein